MAAIQKRLLNLLKNGVLSFRVSLILISVSSCVQIRRKMNTKKSPGWAKLEKITVGSNSSTAVEHAHDDTDVMGLKPDV